MTIKSYHSYGKKGNHLWSLHLSLSCSWLSTEKKKESVFLTQNLKNEDSRVSGKKLQMALMKNKEKLHYMGEIIDTAMTGLWGFLFLFPFIFSSQSEGFLSLTGSTADSLSLLGCQQGCLMSTVQGTRATDSLTTL